MPAQFFVYDYSTKSCGILCGRLCQIKINVSFLEQRSEVEFRSKLRLISD